MAIRRNKTTAISIALILMLATSVALLTVPNVSAKTTLTVSPRFINQIGENTETLIVFILNPNILNTDPGAGGDPNLIGKATIWPDAVFTLTRPDGTTDVVNGPVINRPNVIGGENGRLYFYYTPNMQGTWTINFYWPGDDTYNAFNVTGTFPVGPHIPKRESWCLLSIKPYPVVGLGQDILINAWVTPPPMTDNMNYENYLFTFTRPDGTSFTVGPMDSEGPATVWFNLPLDQLGNWSIKFDFPGNYFALPSTVTRYITVQQEWTPSYPDTPLPTEPWSFPINFENRQWRTIAGAWYESYYNSSQGAWNPYTEAPRTAHILWKIPAYSGIGGFVGSPNGITTGGGQVEYGHESVGLFSSSCYSITTIMAGRGYASAGGMIHCFDMRTGEELWSVEGSFTLGAIRSRQPVLYYFGSSNFMAYNAIDGSLILNVTGMSKTWYVDPYVITHDRTTNRLIKWTTEGTSNNFASRIIWNITNPMAPSGTSASYSCVQSGLIVTRFTEPYVPAQVISNNVTAVDIETGATVYSIFLGTFNDPETWVYRQGPAIGSAYGLIYFANIPATTQGKGYIAIEASTGAIAWRSEQTDFPWGNFWAYMPQTSSDGMIYGCGYTGVWAFNATNGKVVWHYIDDAREYQEEPYSSDIITSDAYPNNLNLSAGEQYATYAFGSTGPIAGGGMLFAPNSEHSPTLYYRGMGMTGIDVFTGEKVWRILGSYSPSALAYGILTASDSVNGYTYAFGKGETATTVSPSSEVIAKGDSVLLKGTVLDMSSAQPGTAAVADADQSEWMEYLHMQQPYPISAQGVSVSLDALDPNNNYVHIGDATSDLTGKYSFLWEPELEGKYTVIASFYSTEAYYGSTAETAIGVTAGPVATAEPTPTPASNTDMYILGIGSAALVLIAVVGIILILMLRKR